MRFVVKTFVFEWVCMLFNQYRLFFRLYFQTIRIRISIAVSADIHVLIGLKIVFCASILLENTFGQREKPTENGTQSGVHITSQ